LDRSVAPRGRDWELVPVVEQAGRVLALILISGGALDRLHDGSASRATDSRECVEGVTTLACAPVGHDGCERCHRVFVADLAEQFHCLEQHGRGVPLDTLNDQRQRATRGEMRLCDVGDVVFAMGIRR
jgi:hypothetical protein